MENQNEYSQEYFDNYKLFDGRIHKYHESRVIKNTLYDIGGAICQRLDNIYCHLDIGCASGYLVEYMRSQGINSSGIDVSEYAISKAPTGIRPYLSQHDITKGVYYSEHSQPYDLITCIEVFEHLNPIQAKYAGRNVINTDFRYLYFSSVDDQQFKFAKSDTHTNVRTYAEWVRFWSDFGLQPVAFENNPIPWGILFAKA